MNYKSLNEDEVKELVNIYNTLKANIDLLHSECFAMLQAHYSAYLSKFNPKFLFIFKRTPYTFEEFIYDCSYNGYVIPEMYDNKKYIEKLFVFSSDSTANKIKLLPKEHIIIQAAKTYNHSSVLTKHDKYINRLVKYAEKPYNLNNSDFDNFDNYKIWNNKIVEVLNNYKNAP